MEYFTKKFNIFYPLIIFAKHSMFHRVLNKLLDYLSCMRMFDMCQTDYSIHCNHLMWYFLSFFHFLHSSVPENKCHKAVLACAFFTRIKLVLSVLECKRPIACIKWRRVGVSKGNQSINQSKTIYFTVHKCMIENLLDYLGNKVVFVQMER